MEMVFLFGETPVNILRFNAMLRYFDTSILRKSREDRVGCGAWERVVESKRDTHHECTLATAEEAWPRGSA